VNTSILSGKALFGGEVLGCIIPSVLGENTPACKFNGRSELGAGKASSIHQLGGSTNQREKASGMRGMDASWICWSCMCG
jgi:hypothetical protein